MSTLILLRHGESEWNAKNLFTGWVDVNLNEKGEREALRGGELLDDRPAARRRAHLAAEARDPHRPARAGGRRPALDPDQPLLAAERAALRGAAGQGQGATLAEFGEEQFMLWRRSYDTPPPPIADDTEFSQFDDPRYAGLPPEARPQTECLKDVVVRMLPYWYDGIVPDLIAGTVPGRRPRQLAPRPRQAPGRHLRRRDRGLNIPTGIPLAYELDADFKP